jgi:hypothetical protein
MRDPLAGAARNRLCGQQRLRVAAAALPRNSLNDIADALHRVLPSVKPAHMAY